MTTTLNAIEVTKRNLEPLIKKVVYTMLELGKQNGLVKSQPKMPVVKFHDAINIDEKEELELIVTKIQNKLMPLIQGIQLVNDVSEEEAIKLLEQSNAEQTTAPIDEQEPDNIEDEQE